ncbi:hypothetical protein [Pelosinus propionicus]|uniref:Bacteriophage T4 Gp32 single-stranded DNA-binding domain-containing protein n=1 Tax=Pelosinus propionicus DSM 13327 TaxID=1123291 RepID=A0A1I4PKL1_9FIRM|nr:hypothetical protein [Pelosinus propionicus]SFM28342.1 hypothetical protein SAMN04490355_106614 [Pelosinus propionicus DSM 13327]
MSDIWGSDIKVEVGKHLKLKNGKNKIRIGSRPHAANIHWEDSFAGKKKKAICPGSGCPLCNANRKYDPRYYVKVINRDDGQATILECGPMILTQIKKYASDSDYGNPMNYDISINKTGEGRNSKYSVMASPCKSSITAEEKTLLEAVDISSCVEPTPIDEIWDMGLVALPVDVPKPQESNVTDDDDWDSVE